MKKKRKGDILQVLTEFEQTVLRRKPTMEQMIRDVSLMKFRIKPIQGEVSRLNFQNREFIEAVWSLGKLDEFYHEKVVFLPDKDKSQFSHYFDSFHKRLQDELNHLNLKREDDPETSALTMEIFKVSKKGKLN